VASPAGADRPAEAGRPTAVAALVRAARAVDAWLFRPGDPRRLAALRIGLAGALTIRLAIGPYLDLARQPAALFRPISFMKLLPAMPPPAVVLPLQVLALAAAALATVGLRTRLTLPLAWLLALPLVAMTSSLGKTVHNDVLLLLCLVPLLPSPAGAAWSLDAWREAAARGRPAGAAPAPSWRFGWPVWTAMAVVSGAYFFTGLAKLLHAGPAWVTSGNLRWVLYGSSDAQARPNPVALFVADRPWLAHLLAAATLAIELGFPLALWRPRLAWLFVPSVIALHAGIWAAMRLDYWPMAATVLIVMVDWPALASRLRARGELAPSSGRTGALPARK
jgi:hypothetical protein